MADLPAICAALVTPVDEQGRPAMAQLSAHANWVLSNGCDGVVLFGTTGEAPGFGLSQRQSALESLVKAGVAAGKVIVGTGCCSVQDTIALCVHALDLGCAGLLIHPPFFFPEPNEDGVFNFYSTVLSGLEKPDANVVLYHFPEMTGVPVTPSLTRRLLEAFPGRIAGIKDSTGNLRNMLDLTAEFPELKIFSGDDHLLWPLLEAGGHGAITATANLAPNLLRAIADGAIGRSEEAVNAQEAMVGLWAETLLKFPVGEAVKEIMAELSGNGIWRNLTPPLCPLPDARCQQLANMVQRYEPLFPEKLALTDI